MGEFLRSRVLLALRLSNVWVQLEALSVRLRRVERDLEQLAEESAPPPTNRVWGPDSPGAKMYDIRLRDDELPARPQTLRAAPPPPPDKPKGVA